MEGLLLRVESESKNGGGMPSHVWEIVEICRVGDHCIISRCVNHCLVFFLVALDRLHCCQLSYSDGHEK